MRKFAQWLRSHIDGRDVLAGGGLALLGYGGEALHPGAGFAASGAVMVAIAALVR